MAAPNRGPTSRKFTNNDVLRCFDEENRRHVGKIELSSAEITEILNSRVLDDEEVTRQAVKNRLDEMEGGQLVKNEHGRSHLYTRKNDLDKLFREPEPVTSPAPGGGGGGGHEPDEKTDDSFTAGMKRAVREYGYIGDIWVPGPALLAIVGFTIWYGLQWFTDDDPRTLGVAISLFAVTNIVALSVILRFGVALPVVAGYLLFLFTVGTYAPVRASRTLASRFGWGDTA